MERTTARARRPITLTRRPIARKMDDGGEDANMNEEQHEEAMLTDEEKLVHAIEVDCCVHRLRC